MDVGSQPHVISQVVAYIVGIVIDDDVIAIPDPIIHVNDVRVRNLEEEPAKTKAVRIAAAQSPYMPSADRSGKVSVLPRMVEVEARIVPFMPDPTIVLGMDVGRFGVAFLIAIGAMVLWGRCLMRRGMWRGVCRCWAVGRNMPIPNAMFAAMLRRLRVWLRSMLIMVFLGHSNGTGQKEYAE